MDSTSRLRMEIKDRLGVLPNFFRLAHEDPQIAKNLWGFAKFAYLDNPLPALFKERLFVSLSRFCEARYCISRHVGFLIGLGRPSGDPRVRAETAEQTVALLRRSLSRGEDLKPLIERVATASSSSEVLIARDSSMEEAVFDCAAHVFLQSPQASLCHEALSRYFDAVTFQHLLVFLTFVRAAHYWTVVHPELEVESDIAQMLSFHDELAECVVAQPKPVSQRLQSLLDDRESLQRERRLRMELERANGELREQRERLQVTLDSIGDAVLTTDVDGRISDMNSVAEQLTGWKNEDATGLMLDRVFQAINERTREPAANPTDAALCEGTLPATSHDALLIAKDGTERPIENKATPIRGTDGQIVGCVLIFRDVTERRARHESAELLAAIVDSSEDAIVSKSLDGVIKTWNASAERLFGYTAEQAVGYPVTMLIPPSLVGEEEMIIARVKAGARVDSFDTVRLRRDGTEVEVSVTISPVKGLDGRVIGASKVARDITDRKKAEETLRKVAIETAEADRRKDRFLAILAHELRNPLSPIRSCIETLKIAPAEKREETLSIIERQVNQMVRLIDDLLDISRISRGKLELRRGQTILQEVICQAMESVEPKITEKRHCIVTDLPDTAISLHADHARLTQVFTNLLTNAARYSPPSSTITVRAVLDEEGISISVADTGFGIAADKTETIFDMFTQVEGASQEAGGLGIGLTMARQLVELHHGCLSVHSDGLGLGATFTVRLPLTVTRAAPRIRPANSSQKDEVLREGVKVLVVDDLQDSANALSMILSLRGCEVRTSFDGPSAICTAEEFKPAVIFLDIGMPGMSGLEVAKHIRSAAWGKGMTLVALSGWGQATDRELTKDAGFDVHLIKPADLDAINRILLQASDG